MPWEAEPLSATGERLRELAVSSVVFNPCGKVPTEGDWLSVMGDNARNLKVVFAY